MGDISNDGTRVGRKVSRTDAGVGVTTAATAFKATPSRRISENPFTDDLFATSFGSPQDSFIAAQFPPTAGIENIGAEQTADSGAFFTSFEGSEGWPSFENAIGGSLGGGGVGGIISESPWEDDAFALPKLDTSSSSSQPQDSFQPSTAEAFGFEANFELPAPPNSQVSPAAAENLAGSFDVSNSGWEADFPPSPPQSQITPADSINTLDTSNTGWDFGAVPSAADASTGGFEGIYSIITKVPAEGEPEDNLDPLGLQVQDSSSSDAAAGFEVNWGFDEVATPTAPSMDQSFPPLTAPNIAPSPTRISPQPFEGSSESWGTASVAIALTTLVQSKSGPVCSTTSPEASGQVLENNPFTTPEAVASLSSNGASGANWGISPPTESGPTAPSWDATSSPFFTTETGKQSPEINGFANDWDSDFGGKEDPLAPNPGGKTVNDEDFVADWGSGFGNGQTPMTSNTQGSAAGTTNGALDWASAFGKTPNVQDSGDTQSFDTDWGQSAFGKDGPATPAAAEAGVLSPSSQIFADSSLSAWPEPKQQSTPLSSSQTGLAELVSPFQSEDFGSKLIAVSEQGSTSAVPVSKPQRGVAGGWSELADLDSQLRSMDSEPKCADSQLNSHAAEQAPFALTAQPPATPPKAIVPPPKTGRCPGPGKRLQSPVAIIPPPKTGKSPGQKLRSSQRNRPQAAPDFTDSKSAAASSATQNSLLAGLSGLSLGANESSTAQMSNPLYKSDAFGSFGQSSFNSSLPPQQQQFAPQAPPPQQFGTAGASQQQFGVQGAPLQQFGTPGAPLQQFGTPGASQQQFGTQGGSQQQFGVQGAAQQQFGVQEASQQQFGVQGAPQQQFGAPQQQFESQGVPPQKFGTQGAQFGPKGAQFGPQGTSQPQCGSQGAQFGLKGPQQQPFGSQGVPQQQQFGQQQQQFGPQQFGQGVPPQPNFGGQGAYQQQGGPPFAGSGLPGPQAPQFGAGMPQFPPDQLGQQGFGVPGPQGAIMPPQQGGPFIPGVSPQQNIPPQPPAPKLSLAPGAFADLLPLALDPKVKEDNAAVKSLTEARNEAKKFEKVSVPTLNDLKTHKEGPKPKPPTGGNLLSFD